VDEQHCEVAVLDQGDFHFLYEDEVGAVDYAGGKHGHVVVDYLWVGPELAGEDLVEI